VYDTTLDLEQEGKYHAIYVDAVQAVQVYTYLTGRFPQQSSSGNKYILVLYDYDSNSIIMHAMMNRSNKEIVAAFDALIVP
jgi:hypothetical protein